MTEVSRWSYIHEIIVVKLKKKILPKENCFEYKSNRKKKTFLIWPDISGEQIFSDDKKDRHFLVRNVKTKLSQKQLTL